jgi:hypothetical protein
MLLRAQVAAAPAAESGSMQRKLEALEAQNKQLQQEAAALRDIAAAHQEGTAISGHADKLAELVKKVRACIGRASSTQNAAEAGRQHPERGEDRRSTPKKAQANPCWSPLGDQCNAGHTAGNGCPAHPCRVPAVLPAEPDTEPGGSASLQNRTLNLTLEREKQKAAKLEQLLATSSASKDGHVVQVGGGGDGRGGQQCTEACASQRRTAPRGPGGTREMKACSWAAHQTLHDA